ncbi:MAG: C40 family peptidase [Epsilonproteobacteria bacterium]|nr:C40 family peptidase [Campylobacterota bacterium]
MKFSFLTKIFLLFSICIFCSTVGFAADFEGGPPSVWKAVVFSPLANVYRLPTEHGGELKTQMVCGERLHIVASSVGCHRGWVEVEALEQPASNGQGITGWLRMADVTYVGDFVPYNCISWGVWCPMMAMQGEGPHASSWVECGVMSRGSFVDNEYVQNKREWFRLEFCHDALGFMLPSRLCSLFPDSQVATLSRKQVLANLAQAMQSEFVYRCSIGCMEDVITLRSYVVAAAKKIVGAQYLPGGRSFSQQNRTCPHGFDESGFVSFVYRLAGLLVGRSIESLFAASTALKSADELEESDLIFLKDDTGKLVHVALYVGNGNIIESILPQVRKTSFAELFGIDHVAYFLSGERVQGHTVHFRSLLTSKKRAQNMRSALMFAGCNTLEGV